MQSLKPILLIEDDQVDAMTVKRALKELEITNKLVHKTNGEEALEYLQRRDSEKPCVVLLDLNTPRMNGMEFLAIVKADETLKDIPAIVLTTSSGEDDSIESFKLGAAGYMVKSVDYKEFVESMKTVTKYCTVNGPSEGRETVGRPA